jgi:hypothetical protein
MKMCGMLADETAIQWITEVSHAEPYHPAASRKAGFDLSASRGWAHHAPRLYHLS